MDIYMKDGKALSYNGQFFTPKPTSETWVLNELIDPASFGKVISFTIRFISNGELFYSIEFQNNKGGRLYYGAGSVYTGDGVSGLWMGDFGSDTTAYRTITFLEPPTGDLLTWLNENGVKQ